MICRIILFNGGIIVINLAIFFGGESCEHDISIITGVQLMSKVNSYLYNVVPIYITKDGEWKTGKSLFDLDNYPDGLGKLKTVGMVAGDNTLYQKCGKKLKKLVEVDVGILCLHGVNGEDGSLSALLNLSGVTYVNCDILASSVCLDKIVFNNVCKGLDIPKVDFVSIFKNKFLQEKDLEIEKVKNLGFPVIIKPSRQGSSIGIKVCYDLESLENDLNFCFEYDDRLVVEKYVKLKKEVNIACFNNKSELIFSKTEEPISGAEFLNFDDKYVSSMSGMDRMKRLMPANIDEECDRKIKDIVKLLYVELDMFGVVRFDFLIDMDDNVYVNEVNTIPGSMANYLFKDDLSYPKLIEDLISNALIRNENKRKLHKTFASNVLKQGLNGLKK